MQGIFFEQTPQELTARIEEINSGSFSAEWSRILSLSKEEIETVSLA
jgi:hypothetical protein